MTNPPGVDASDDVPREVYLDSASGMSLHPAARSILERALTAAYADPRRLHQAGRRAQLVLENARASVAESLGVRPDEVTFTSSGTRACHLGLLGLARPGATVVASAVEHNAVMHAGEWHAERGGGFETAPVDSLGRLLPGTPTDADVLALQSANHEVGTVQHVDEVAAAHAGAVFVDACASGGRLALPRRWDAVALSAHKWGGPAGVGVLLVRKGARWRPPFPADDRADERATGFENVPAALAAAAALAEVVAGTDEQERQRRLIDRVRASVAHLEDIDVVGDPVDRLPHLVTFSCLYVDGEALVTELDRRGFGVASGSACTASTLQPSHVLAAMGALTQGNVRLSVDEATTEADIDRFLAILPGTIADLRAQAGL